MSKSHIVPDYAQFANVHKLYSNQQSLEVSYVEIDNTPSYEIIGVKGVILRRECIEKEGISQFRTFFNFDDVH